jgi:galactonate dehydratase
MKIVSVEVFLLDGGSPGWRPVVCRVNTDEGISGYGEASVGFDTGASASYAMIKEVAPFVIGMDPMATEAVWEKMYSQTFWAQGGGTIMFSAISAIDTACWDIKAKACSVPLYKLLGGKVNTKLRAYASQLQFGWGDSGMVFDHGYKTEDLVESSLKAVKEGYDAIKINFITYDSDGSRLGFLKGPIKPRVRKLIEERVRAVREAVGDDIDILVENHARTDAVSAVEMSEIIAPYHIMFMEEACTPMNLQVLKTVRDRSKVIQAGGERVYGKYHYANLMKNDCYQIYQPDIGTCGGVTEAKKIADMAAAVDAGIQIHVCGSPIAIAASLQVEASIPNFVIHEHHVTNKSENNIRLCVNNYQPINGYCEIPEIPGIGNELSKWAIDHALAKEVVKGGN